ncbi:MAG: hypothetical protein IPP71_07440 [Bacteroidetes bacterium]|nr:hypothetical protein [Bacteroidota bacterium]
MTVFPSKLYLFLALAFTFLASSVHAQITFQKVIGSTDYEEGMAVLQTNDQGYIMTGFTYGMGAGQYDTYLI